MLGANESGRGAGEAGAALSLFPLSHRKPENQGESRRPGSCTFLEVSEVAEVAQGGAGGYNKWFAREPYRVALSNVL